MCVDVVCHIEVIGYIVKLKGIAPQNPEVKKNPAHDSEPGWIILR